MSKSILFCLFFTLLAARNVEAQQSAREASPYEWRVEYFTTEDGLPSNDVFSVRQDDLGFLWIGTRNGLVRDEGYTFTTYRPRPDDSTSIGGNFIWTLHHDAPVGSGPEEVRLSRPAPAASTGARSASPATGTIRRISTA